MVMISFVVAAYNVESTISRCLESLVRQTFDDIEIVVVNDASTDGTLTAVQQYAQQDTRVQVIDKPKNRGLHLARRTGAARTHGQYVMFVDGDDELELTAAEILLRYLEHRDCDMLKFGRQIIPVGETASRNMFAEEHAFNVSVGTVRGEDIVSSIFSETLDTRTTWSMIDILFKGDFVRRGFAGMADEYLGNLEDSYECFVLASQADTMRSFTEFRPLRYYFGGGISGYSHIAVDVFERNQDLAHASMMSVLDYARECHNETITRCARWYELTVLGIEGREWVGRVAESEQLMAAQMLRNTWGDEYTVGMILEPLLPRARFIDADGHYPAEADPYVRWSRALHSMDLDQVKDPVILEQLREYQCIDERIEQREQERLEEERRQHIEQMRIERERLLAEQREADAHESKRLFKQGSAPRRLLDSVFPESGKVRHALRRIALVVLRR